MKSNFQKIKLYELKNIDLNMDKGIDVFYFNINVSKFVGNICQN